MAGAGGIGAGMGSRLLRLNQRGWAWWAGRPFWATVQAVGPMARPGWHVRAHGPGVCARGGQVAQARREGAFVVGAPGVMDRCRQPV
jgi:hypothetical protein